MNTRQLTAIQIPAIDLTGNGGLGWADLKDPQKGVAMFALTPIGTVKGDHIELFWNGQVIQELLTDPERPSIDFSVLPRLIPDQPEISEVFYRITPAGNGTPEDSPVRKVRVKRTVPGGLDPDESSTPYINENLAPVENLPSTIEEPVDLSLTIPPWINMHVGDVLRLFWGGNEFFAENPKLPPDEIGKPQTVMVSAALQEAAGNSDNLIVNYEVRDVVNNWSLYSVGVSIQVDLPIGPPAPTVSEAPDGMLEPLKVEMGATVVVSYPGMLVTDEIRVRWNDHEDVSEPLSQPGNAAGRVRFTINPDAIAPVVGKSLKVRYVVTRGGEKQVSEALPLTIQTLPASALPKPRIVQALDEHVLNVSSLTGDADLTVEKWPFIVTGQRVWLVFQGIREDGSNYQWDHPVWYSFAIPDNKDQSTTVALSELQKLKEGSTLRLVMWLTLDDGLNTTLFPVKELTIAFYHPVSGSEDWERLNLDAWPLNHPMACSDGMHLTVSGARATIVDLGTIYTAFGQRTLQAAPDSTLTFHFGGFIETLVLTYAEADSEENLVEFFDAHDGLISSARLKSSDGTSSDTINFSRPCVYCRITLKGNSGPVLLDRLAWTAWSA